MLGLKMTKKGFNGNVRDRSKSRERVSLLGNKNGGSNGGLRGQEGRRRTRGGEQEMVSLLGKPSLGKRIRKYDNGRKKAGKRDLKSMIQNIRWTRRTLFALLIITSFVTYKVFQKGAKLLNWGEFDKLLAPQAPQEERCFEETIEIISHVTGKSRKLPCACPEPNIALENTEDALWKSNHKRMVSEAINAPKDLDIVFFGDGMVEQLSGSRGLGAEMLDGMEHYFETSFRKARGGKFNAIALGSSGDTVCLQNSNCLEF